MENGRTKAAHIDQLKACEWMPEKGVNYPLVFRRSEARQHIGTSPPLEKVKGHRLNPDEYMEFLV